MPSVKLKLLVAAACDALQVLPLSVLYCQVAPASTPLTVTPVLLVKPSVLLLPVSAVKAKLGALGSVVSIVQLLVLLPTVDTLPAVSVCRTCTAPVA